MTTKQAKQLIGKTVELRNQNGHTRVFTVLMVDRECMELDRSGMIVWTFTPFWTFVREVE